MPLVPITVPPGVIKIDSDYAASGRWIDADKVRFVKDKPEKLGGIEKFSDTAFTGIIRGAKAWNTYANIPCLAYGSAYGLSLYRQSIIANITPYRLDAINLPLADPFTTTDTSAVVTVSHIGHGIKSAGVGLTFSGAAAVGGITIDGDYTVTAIVDDNTYTITHSAAATSTATGGGSGVTVSYELNDGDIDPAYIRGWGVPLWGGGGWGEDAPLSSSVVSDPRVWSLATYGEDLLINPVGGAIYYYDSSTGLSRPNQLANSPSTCLYVFVTAERYIMALGVSTIDGGQDNMSVRWPDILDVTDWTPSAVNTSNERKLQGGTRLVAGTQLTDGLSLVWSDQACFSFQYTGSDEVYSSRKVAGDCGLVSPQAFTTANAAAFWMGRGNFWMYNGYVQPIPNAEDVFSWVQSNVNQEHIFKVFSFYNADFNEVWFVFPTGSSTEPDTYVMVSLDGFYWTNGTISRSSHAAFSSGSTNPILFGTNGYIYSHDITTATDNDGSAMQAFIELAPTDIQGGNNSVDIFGIVPDFQRQSGNVDFYIYGRDHPRDTDFMNETVTVSPTDRLADARIAGRQFGMKLTSNTLGGDFRLGKFELEISATGNKR